MLTRSDSLRENRSTLATDAAACTDRRRGDARTDEPLAHLLTALADRAGGETGCVQVVVTAQRHAPAMRIVDS